MTAQKCVRIILSREQTADIILQAGGENRHGRVFAVASPGSWPDAHGRLVLHLVECSSMKVAADACEVAMGSKRAARKPKKCTVTRAREEGSGQAYREVLAAPKKGGGPDL